MEKIKKFLFVNSNTKQTIVKNTFWLFSGEILGRLLRMALILYAARILGKEGWGVFSYTISLVGVAMVFSDMGLSVWITKKASENTEDKDTYISTAFYFKMIISTINIILAIIILPFIVSIPESKTILPLVVFLLFFDSIREFLIGLNRATEKMEKEGFIKILTNFLIAGFGFAFLVIAPSTKNFALSYFLGSMIGTISLILIIKNIFKKAFKGFKKEYIKKIWGSAWPIGAIGLFMVVIGNIDAFMLGIWRDSGEIGLYGASQRLIIFFHIVPVLMSSAIIPAMTRALFEEKNNQKVKEILETALSGTIILAIPMILGGAFFSKEILGFLLGEEYILASRAFIILATSLLFVLPNIILINTIIIFEKQKQFIKPIVIGMILNITLNIIFIPKFGIVGAAFTTLLSQIYIFTANYLGMKKVQYFSIKKYLPKIFFANIIFLLFILIFKKIDINIIILILILAFIYPVILHILKEPVQKKILEIIR